MSPKAKKMCIVLFVLVAALIFPALAVASGEPENMITKDDVLKMVRENQVDPIKELSKTCGECHGRDTKYPVLGARQGYENSGHYLGYDKQEQNSYYANGSGCQQCHTNEGFIQYTETGKVDASSYVSYPSQIGCFTCHDPHTTGDFSLTQVKPVTLVDGAVFDAGKGNLCASCHQARSAAKDIVVAMPADKITSHWGAHHGPEADVFLGTNAYQFPGKSYGSSPHTYAVQDSCVTCHMALPDGRYSLSSGIGGHSFSLKGEVHGSETLNLSACTSCHTDMKQEGEYFSIKKADYDNDGKVEPIQAEVEGLLEMLVNTNGTGLLQKLPLPVYKADGSFNTTSSTEVRPIAQVAAVYNYRLFEEDRSLGVHNTKYTIEVLYDTIQALDPTFDVSKRP